VNKDQGASSGSDDVVGRFRSGFQTTSGDPVGLSEFRVTTGDPDIAAAVRELLGGEEPETWDTKTEETFQVFTEASSVDVIFEPGSVKSSLTLWSNKGKKIIETDGEYLYDLETGKLTDIPWDGAELDIDTIKMNARNGVGPGPSLQAYFRLAGNPDLGKFRFFSGGWTAVASFNKAEAAMRKAEGPHFGVLELEHVEFKNKKGQQVSYYKPQITIGNLVPQAEAA